MEKAQKKRKRQELRETLKDQTNEWSHMEAQKDEIKKGTKEVLGRMGKATTERTNTKSN